MRQRFYSFLVVLLLMFCVNQNLIGQNPFFKFDETEIPFHPTSEWFNKQSPSEIIKRIGKLNVIYFPVQLFDNNLYHYSSPIIVLYPVFSLSSNFYSNNLGVVCKKELQLDKLTPVQFRFRLGSLEYTNWMEGKPNATHILW